MEQELIKRAQDGDRGAFEQIYQRYRDYMLSLAMHLTGHGSWAEDVVQDVFVRFIDSLETFQLCGSLKGYFSVCVANKARDLLRRQKVRVSQGLDAANDIAGGTDGPLKLLVSNEEKLLVRQGLAKLPYDQREVIALHSYGGMEFKEIAVALDIPVKTAYSRWSYGIDKLRVLIVHEN
ncbi:MAG: RNA polymerase sigma factor [Phycisphaerae bacterium]|nr:RNA polymerase sigma factor [Phycisphaerae bacterium]